MIRHLVIQNKVFRSGQRLAVQVEALTRRGSLAAGRARGDNRSAAPPSAGPPKSSMGLQIENAQGLFVREFGSGLPLLLLHGLMATGDLFRPVVAAHATQHRLIVPDLRGYGRSAHLPGPYTPRQLAADLGHLFSPRETLHYLRMARQTAEVRFALIHQNFDRCE
jgi:pimeloyl-ACP methyl ester carboxylesterase